MTLHMATNSDNTPLKPGVSVVVCCYNSSDIIVPTIKALSQQEILRNIGYEVILVDNNCTDNTVQLAKEAWKNPFYSMKIIEEKEPGLIYARKTGVKNAHYDILLFIDDDNILNPDWVKQLYHLYETMPDVGTIGGFNEPLIQGEKPEWFERYQVVYACGPRDDKPGLNPKRHFGAGLSFRTEILKSVLFSDLPTFLVGNTKNTLTRGEDTEMALRCLLMGWKSYYDHSLQLRHNLIPRRMSWNYVCRVRIGGGAAGLILKIYRDLLEGREPLHFSQLVLFVLKSWKDYFKRAQKPIFYRKKEGSPTSFLFYWLLGMSRGLFLYGKTYRGIRKRVVEHFKIPASKTG